MGQEEATITKTPANVLKIKKKLNEKISLILTLRSASVTKSFIRNNMGFLRFFCIFFRIIYFMNKQRIYKIPDEKKKRHPIAAAAAAVR